MMFWSVIIGMLTFALLAGGIVFFNLRYQKQILQKQNELHKKESGHRLELIRTTIEITEKERKRIASDLHDEIGSHLSTIRMMLNSISKSTNENSAIIASESKSLLDNTIASVRTISHNLLPPTLDKFGLINTVDDLCEKLKSTGIKITLNHNGDFIILTKEQELALFRIIQELTTNTLKYANATTITIEINIVGNILSLNYNDDGMGMDLMILENKKGLGMMNIESRAIAINGSVKFVSTAKNGFSALINIHL